jgi:hypothetical protein
VNVIASALWSRLSSSGTVTNLLPGTSSIYRAQAPDGATLPYIVFSEYAGGPMNITPSDLRDPVYFVRAYGTTAAQAGSVDARVSLVLHHGSLTVSDYNVVGIFREQDYELVETLPNGNLAFMSGGLYRITLDD